MRCYKKLLMSTLLLLLLIFSWVSSPSSSRFISRKRRRTSGIQPQWDFSSSKHEHLSKLWALFRLHITFPMINQRGVTRDVNVTCSKQRQSYCKCVMICSNNLFSNSEFMKKILFEISKQSSAGSLPSFAGPFLACAMEQIDVNQIQTPSNCRVCQFLGPPFKLHKNQYDAAKAPNQKKRQQIRQH